MIHVILKKSKPKEISGFVSFERVCTKKYKLFQENKKNGTIFVPFCKLKIILRFYNRKQKRIVPT